MTTEDKRDWREDYMYRFYRSKPGYIKESDAWYKLVVENTPPDSCILEIGGGPAEDLTRRLRPRAKYLVGVDVDPVVRNNSLLDKAVVYDGGRFEGVEDGTMDVAVGEWVNEHVPNPQEHFKEVSRVLKPGGLYMFRTVNFFHYKALVAQVTPHQLAVPLVRFLRNLPEEHYDAYKTYYRANSRGRILALCRQAGLEPVIYRASEGIPYYGLGSRLLFLSFMAYERVVNSADCFANLRHTIDCVLRKK